MKKRKRLSYEEKVQMCIDYDQGLGSQHSLAIDYGISQGGFKHLYFKYKNFGSDSLRMQKNHKIYTKNLKEKIIESYNEGNWSYSDLAVKYKISNSSLISRWVLGYNNSNKTTYGRLGGVTMKGRKTTLDERVEVISYLIDNDIDYNRTSTHFKVSYQQVYTWYNKYKKLGLEGLLDNRGRKRNDDTSLSELELLRKENSRLKKELELTKATKEVLKKKQELEQEAHLRELEIKKRMKR